MLRSIVILIFMNFVWSGSYVAAKLGLETMPPLSLVFWRMGVSAVLLLGWIIIKKIPLRLRKKDVLLIIALGSVTAGAHILWVTGLSYSHASDASLLYAFEPIWTIILASLILKEPFRPAMAVGLGLAFIGLVILSNISFLTIGSLFAGSVALGNILIVCGLFCESLFSIIAKPLSSRQSPIVVIALALVVTEILLSVPMMLTKGFMIPKTAHELGSVFYLSIPCTVVGYVLWVKLMRNLQVNVMLYTVFIQPVVGPLIAMITIGEILDQRLFNGAIFIFAGVFTAITSHVLSYRAEASILASPVISTDSD